MGARDDRALAGHPPPPTPPPPPLREGGAKATRRALLTTPFLAATANAQSWSPDRPLRLIIPVAVAGASDIVGRILAERMAALLGRPVVVENIAGAGSTIGAQSFLRLPADGHALFLGTNNHALMKLVYPTIPYDPEADFAPLALVSRQPFILAVNNAVPARSVPELLAWLRDRGDAANFGAAAPGANNFMAGELLKRLAGVRFTIVSYRSAPASVQDVMAGRLDLTIDSASLVLPLVRSGGLRGLAVSSAEPSALAPELPTLAAAGVPGYDQTIWTMLFARSDVPLAALATLRAAVAQALADPAVQARMLAAGFEPWPDRSDSAAAGLLRREIARWTPLIPELNLTPG